MVLAKPRELQMGFLWRLGFPCKSFLRLTPKICMKKIIPVYIMYTFTYIYNIMYNNYFFTLSINIINIIT